MILKRAAAIVLLLALSVVLFPLLAFGVTLVGLSQLTNHLFFWPQYLLAPHGFVNHEFSPSGTFLMDTAIFGAILFWLICAVGFGYLTRDIKMRYVLIGTYPVAGLIMVLVYWVLSQFGYVGNLDSL